MPGTPPTFLFTLGALSYRLLFHSERELNLFSLIFCVSCAWCVTQLALNFKMSNATVDSDNVSNDAFDIYSRMVYDTITRIVQLAGQWLAHSVHFGCGFFTMGPESRETCFEWGNWIQGKCSF